VAQARRALNSPLHLDFDGWLQQPALPPLPSSEATAESLCALLQRAAAEAEPETSRMLRGIAAEYGGTLVDEMYRLKSPSSLLRKCRAFVEKLREASGGSQQEAEAALFALHTTSPGVAGQPVVVDALRYTLIFERDRYTEAAKAIRSAVVALRGEEAIVDRKNFWDGLQPYRGINDIYACPVSSCGPCRTLLWEVQMHTPESYKLKSLVHPLYQRFRVAADKDARLALFYRMCSLAVGDGVPVPEGVLDLPTVTIRPPPPGVPRVHTHARSQQVANYPQRAAVRDVRLPWQVPWADYQPPEFTASSVLNNMRGLPSPSKQWADPADALALRETLRGRTTFIHDTAGCSWGQIDDEACFDAFEAETGRPINPLGRTGLRGRGRLGKWGPNQAADPIVTRYNPAVPGQLQMVAIERYNPKGAWAIPGGMVDDGEVVSEAVRREFEEEAGNVPQERQAVFKQLVDRLFSTGEVVYRGYVDDPRNTDNAWMETTAFHFHCSLELGGMLPLQAGDDARKVAWIVCDAEVEPRFANLYADHRKFVDALDMSAHPDPRCG